MVMVDESVLGLSPVATAILEAVPEGMDVGLPTVTQHVVATFGPPAGTESAEALTEQQIWDLVAHRVLVVVEDEGSRDGTSSLLDHRVDSAGDDPEGAVTALRDALRHLRSDDDGRWAAPDSLSPRGLVVAARQHHVVPYLAANLDRLDIPGQARSELEAAAGRQHAGAAVLAADLSVALAALREAGASTGVQGRGARGSGLRRLRNPRGGRPRPARRPAGPRARSSSAVRAPAGRRRPDIPCPGPSWAWRHFVRTGNELTAQQVLAATSTCTGTSCPPVAPSRTPRTRHVPDFDTLWERRETCCRRHRRPPCLRTTPWRTRPVMPPRTSGAGCAACSTCTCWCPTATPGSAPTGRSRGDQLISLGLAVREFGTPPGDAAGRGRALPSSRLTSCGRQRAPRAGDDGARSTDRFAVAGHATSCSACAESARTERVAARGCASAEQERASARGLTADLRLATCASSAVPQRWPDAERDRREADPRRALISSCVKVPPTVAPSTLPDHV